MNQQAKKEMSQQAEKEACQLIEVEGVCQLIVNLDQKVKVKVKVEAIHQVQGGVDHLDGKKVNQHHRQQIDEVLLILRKCMFLIILYL